MSEQQNCGLYTRGLETHSLGTGEGVSGQEICFIWLKECFKNIILKFKLDVYPAMYFITSDPLYV